MKVLKNTMKYAKGGVMQMKQQPEDKFLGWEVNGKLQQEMPEAFRQSLIIGFTSILKKPQVPQNK